MAETPQKHPVTLEDEMRRSYLDYAMSVIIGRALPDVRDGLKPSQRRILVAMNDLNLGPASSTTKCAGIIGGAHLIEQVMEEEDTKVMTY